MQLKPLVWEQVRNVYSTDTIFGKLEVVSYTYQPWRWFRYADGEPIGVDVANLEDGKRKAEEWYLEQLKPAFDEQPKWYYYESLAPVRGDRECYFIIPTPPINEQIRDRIQAMAEAHGKRVAAWMDMNVLAHLKAGYRIEDLMILVNKDGWTTQVVPKGEFYVDLDEFYRQALDPTSRDL